MSTNRGNVTTRTATARQQERIAVWPRVSACVRSDGTGTITINGTERPCRAPSVDELRTGMIARCVSLAVRLSRPVRLTVTDGAATWNLAVRPEGIVQLVDDAGMIAPADGLSVHEGRCRVCRRLQGVTSTCCPQCGTDEPHRVEANPVDAHDVVPDAEAVDVLEGIDHTVPRAPGRRPRPTMRLTFSTQPPIEVTENVSLGRKPEPIGGRRPIRITSPTMMLSRTHLVIDVDADGRIIVTDQDSGNGTEAQTDPPTKLGAGIPYVVHEGTTLLLGDVDVLIELA